MRLLQNFKKADEMENVVYGEVKNCAPVFNCVARIGDDVVTVVSHSRANCNIAGCFKFKTDRVEWNKLNPHFTRNLTTLETNPIDEGTRKIVEMFGFAESSSYDMFDGHLRGI